MNREMTQESILVAMSGGVDSSVTALLLKKAGYNVKGAILRMHDADMSPEDLVNGKLPQSIWYAREAARKMRLDFSIIDVREIFQKEVVGYFVSSWQQGITPNPCIFCNPNTKFPQMFQAAERLGCSKVASGHYANIGYNGDTGRYTLSKGKDLSKDQSYMLYRLSQKALSRLVMPLGAYTKEEIRTIAKDAGLKNAKAPDSQDICFIPDGDYGKLLQQEFLKMAGPDAEAADIPGLAPGNFVDLEGNVLGRHNGLIHYTIGQRRGLGLSLPESLYVCEKRMDVNEVVLCPDEKLYKDTVRAGQVCFVSIASLPAEGMRVSAKIRYSSKETPGLAKILEDGTLEVKFDDAVRAPTPGQSMVLYKDDLVLAGGIIL